MIRITKEQCLTEMNRILKANPTVPMTRDFFRSLSTVSDYQWEAHFGAFKEFKRAAGLEVTKHQGQFRNDTAKHASLDNYKKLTLEKQEYAGKYLRPNGKRFKTGVIGSDIHDICCDPFYRKMFIEAVKRTQPDFIVINGDLFDLPEFGKYSVDPREWDVVGRIKWVHKFLHDIREACPDAEIHIVEGNHEYRLMRHLAEATPAMKAILSDLHGFTVSKLLGLDQFQVNYVAPADLATLTKTDAVAELRRNFLIIDGLLLCHHFPEGSSFGMPGVNGHHHSHEVRTFYNPTFGSYEWHQLGSGHKREASFTNGEKWTNGFTITHLDILKKRVQFEYVDTTHDFAMMGGKLYDRS